MNESSATADKINNPQLLFFWVFFESYKEIKMSCVQEEQQNVPYDLPFTSFQNKINGKLFNHRIYVKLILHKLPIHFDCS